MIWILQQQINLGQGQKGEWTISVKSDKHLAITEELWREKKRESDKFSFVVFSGNRQILYDPNYSIADLAVDRDKNFSEIRWTFLAKTEWPISSFVKQSNLRQSYFEKFPISYCFLLLLSVVSATEHVYVFCFWAFLP